MPMPPLLQALKSRWHLPYGAVVHPMAQAGGVVPVANPTGGTIIRCKRCRTYINPFMSWMDGGRWVVALLQDRWADGRPEALAGVLVGGAGYPLLLPPVPTCSHLAPHRVTPTPVAVGPAVQALLVQRVPDGERGACGVLLLAGRQRPPPGPRRAPRAVRRQRGVCGARRVHGGWRGGGGGGGRWAERWRRIVCSVVCLEGAPSFCLAHRHVHVSCIRVVIDARHEFSCPACSQPARPRRLPAAAQVRAPMPPTYVFVIDVSFAAAACGMLGAACSTIKASLDSLPGDERTQVAFITFDK